MPSIPSGDTTPVSPDHHFNDALTEIIKTPRQKWSHTETHRTTEPVAKVEIMQENLYFYVLCGINSSKHSIKSDSDCQFPQTEEPRTGTSVTSQKGHSVK